MTVWLGSKIKKTFLGIRKEYLGNGWDSTNHANDCTQRIGKEENVTVKSYSQIVESFNVQVKPYNETVESVIVKWNLVNN